jgi:hypothetical protein
MSRVKCQSGSKGWQQKLQTVYSSFSEFANYCFMYNNHARLGFASPEEAWKANPIIQGSVNPTDYRKV